MLRWTAAGAVAEPAAVQVRVASRFPGRIAAGAPSATRDLTPDEVLANLKWFAVDRVGPRAAACTAAVLSGVTDPAALVPVLAAARSFGVQRVTWHLGEEAPHPELAAAVDVVVAVMRSARPAAVPGARELHVVIPLEHDVLARLDAITAELAARPPDRVVFQWPLPGATAPPPPAHLAAATVRPHLARLSASSVPVGVKGLPPCVLAPGPVLGSWGDHAWRTGNRWYVDADHQKDAALMFFPDLVRQVKVESCRFCDASPACDGVAEDWLRQGLVGPLTPIR